jgi:hypothetical protein
MCMVRWIAGSGRARDVRPVEVSVGQKAVRRMVGVAWPPVGNRGGLTGSVHCHRRRP